MRATSIICCWNCKATSKTLRNVKDDYGFKTDDYVCTDCAPVFPKPQHPNKGFSRIVLPTLEEDEHMKKMLERVQGGDEPKP